MDELTWVDYTAVGVALAAAVFAGIEAWNARGARRDAAAASKAAGAHERAAAEASAAANAARADASSALIEIAALMKDQVEARPDWVPTSHGGGHLRWDMTNHTGKVVQARLEFPDQGAQHIFTTDAGPGFEEFIDPGEAIEFTWERRGPGTSSSALVHVKWSDLEGRRERLERVRVTLPPN